MQLLLQAHSGSPLSPRLGIDMTCSRYSIGFSSIDIIHSLLFFISLNVPVPRELDLFSFALLWHVGYRLLAGSFVLPDYSYFEGQSPYVFGFAALLDL